MEPLYRQFLVIIAALLPTYLIRFTVFGIPTTLLEVLIWIAVVVGMTQGSIRHSWWLAWRQLPKIFLLFVFLFLLSAVISTGISPHLTTSLGILKGWIITPLVYAFLMYAAGVGNEKLKLEVGKALMLSGLVMALLGLSQLGRAERITGLYDVPNSLALYLVPIIILALFSTSSKFHLLAASVMMMALLLTQSLAGILTVLIVVSIGAFGVKKKLRLKLWAPLIGIAAVSLVILWPKIDYLMQPGSSAHVRLQLWSVSTELIKKQPLTGIGLGTFEPAYQEKLHERFARPAFTGQPAPLAEFVFRDPHNWLLSFWLNLGLLGLISFIFLNVWALRQGFKNQNQGVALALLTLLLFGLVDTIYWKNDLATLHWLFLALLVRSFTDPAIVK